MQALPIFHSSQRHVPARLDVGEADLRRLPDLVLFGMGLVDQAPDGFLQKRSRAGGRPLRDLPLDHSLQLVGQLNDTHPNRPRQ